MSLIDDIIDDDPGERQLLPSPRDPMAVARQLVADLFTHVHDDEASVQSVALPQRIDSAVQLWTLKLRRYRGGWWTWKTTHWSEVEDAVVRTCIYSFTESALFLDTSKKFPTEEPWAPNRYKVADVLEALGAVTHLPDKMHPPTWTTGDGLHPADELVSVKNGLLHVTTRTLSNHDARLFNTVGVPFAYDPNAKAPAWERFLASLWGDDAESIKALQEFMGYVISGRTDLQKMLLLIGPTRAGKGVIARVLKALVGAGNCAGPTLASLGQNFGLQPLIGKPLAIISDARLGSGRNGNVQPVVERLLSISGEDMLTVDRKYREPWTGTLPTRFFIISNELPRFGDASGAIAARFVVLSLSESWLGKENPNLTQELLADLPGILNWALEGLARLTAAGRLTEPTTSRDAIIALQDLVSPVAAFVRERCERGPHEIECSILYQAWKGWAEENGHRPGSLQSFGRDLRAVVPGLRTGRPRTDDLDRPRHYHGIRLALRHYNGKDCGPSRTSPETDDLVRDGPRTDPLYRQGPCACGGIAVAWGADTAWCARCWATRTTAASSGPTPE